MDRTREFFTILQTVNPSVRVGNGDTEMSSSFGGRNDFSTSSSSTAAAPLSVSRSAFNTEAARIGVDIEATQLRLQELGKRTQDTSINANFVFLVAKQKSLFNDSTARTNDLSNAIAQDISNLNSRLTEIEGQFGINSSSIGGGIEQHMASAVKTLRQRLQAMTKELTDTLELRTRIIQEQDSRRNRYFTPSIAAEANAITIGHQHQNNFAQSNDDLENGEQSAMLQESYHTSRLTSVQGIQRKVAELSQMFSKMAQTIQQQDELVQRIDQNVDDSQSNVREGQSQLLKYFNSISGNRALILKVFAILICFAIILALTS